MRSYDKEFKLNAVKLYESSGRSYKKVAEEMGIPEATLVGWVHAHKQSGTEAFPGKGHVKPSEQEITELHRELAIVREERDILKKALGIYLLINPQMKYEFMKQHQAAFSIERMSCVFNVSRSGYYRYIDVGPSKRAQENEHLVEKIKVVHVASRQTYGSPRIHAQLREQGETCSRKRVAKLMRKAGVQAKMKQRFKVTTRVNPAARAAPNLLQQDFTAQQPNQRWVADFTYVATQEGWLYVAVVLDLFSRCIVGLAMSKRMTANLVMSALQQALLHRQPDKGLIHHSDRGCQYTSEVFQGFLQQHGIIVSMSGTGNCYDNAAMESFFHTLKTEHIYFEQYLTREQAKRSIFEYAEVFYNRQRKHSTLGYLSPLMFEKQWQQLQDVSLLSVH